MDRQIIDRLRCRTVLVAGHADVALFEQKAIMILGHQDPKPDVELPIRYEHRLLDILLDHKQLRLNLLGLRLWG